LNGTTNALTLAPDDIQSRFTVNIRNRRSIDTAAADHAAHDSTGPKWC
jgi:hypothetical protein